MAEAKDDSITPPGRRPFKTAKQLGIAREARDAITSVLGMLERGELIYATNENYISHGINMGSPDRDFACWLDNYVNELPPSLDPLVHPPAELNLESLTVPEIIAAIRSYLLDGVVRWRGVESVADSDHGMKRARGAESWVAGEIKRMVAAGEIREGTIHAKLRIEAAKILNFEGSKLTSTQEARLDGIKKRTFAKLLEARMRKAARIDQSVHPVDFYTIENRLVAWGFWPLTRIK